MPYCPDCGVEYRAGFDTCSDCWVALQAEFPSDIQVRPRPNGWLGAGLGAFWGSLVGVALYPGLIALSLWMDPRSLGMGSSSRDMLFCIVTGVLAGGFLLGMPGGCILGWLPVFIAESARRIQVASMLGAVFGGGFGLLMASQLPPIAGSAIACSAAGAAAGYLAASTFERLERTARRTPGSRSALP